MTKEIWILMVILLFIAVMIMLIRYKSRRRQDPSLKTWIIFEIVFNIIDGIFWIIGKTFGRFFD
jgi:hypothetical protein